MAKTCTVGPGGKRKRKPTAPPEASEHLLNPLHPPEYKGAKRRGTGYGDASLKERQKQHGTAKAVAGPSAGFLTSGGKTMQSKNHKSGKRMTERQLRARSKPTKPKPLPKPRKPRMQRRVNPQVQPADARQLEEEMEVAREAEVRARAEQVVNAKALQDRISAAAARARSRQDLIGNEQARVREQRAAQEREQAAQTLAQERAAVGVAAADQERVHLAKRIKSLERLFAVQHGRLPTGRDIRKPEYTEWRVMLGRYKVLRNST